jgi:hypothetical protein
MTITDGAVLLVALLVSVVVGLTKSASDPIGPPIPKPQQVRRDSEEDLLAPPFEVKRRLLMRPVEPFVPMDEDLLIDEDSLSDEEVSFIPPRLLEGRGEVIKVRQEISSPPSFSMRRAEGSWEELRDQMDEIRSEAEQLKQAVERMSDHGTERP